MTGCDESDRPSTFGATVWLTGLPGAGKTTLSRALAELLARIRWPVCVLDGDELRRGLSSDLGLSAADRSEQARRAAHVAALVGQSQLIAIVALVSPYADDRRRARQIHAEAGLPFFEVWVDTPLAVCESRDPKGLYALARRGALTGLTGIDAPYEPPATPDLRVTGSAEPPTRAAKRIVELLARALPAPLDEMNQLQHQRD